MLMASASSELRIGSPATQSRDQWSEDQSQAQSLHLLAELERVKTLCMGFVSELEQQINMKDTEIASWKQELAQAKEQMKELEMASARDRLATGLENDRLRVENAKLRERNIKFDALQSEFKNMKKGDKIGAKELVEKFTKQIAFYEDQLALAESTLQQSVQSANNSNLLMMGEIQSLEKELALHKQFLAEALGKESFVEASGDAPRMDSIQARMKLSDTVTKLEVKLAATNLELLKNTEALEKSEKRNAELERELAALRGGSKKSQAQTLLSVPGNLLQNLSPQPKSGVANPRSGPSPKSNTPSPKPP
eukprot:g77679.t1